MSKSSKSAPSWATRSAAPVAPPPEDDEAAAFEREAAEQQQAAAPILSPDVTAHAPPPPPPGMVQVEPDVEVVPADDLEGDVPRDGSLIFLIGEPVADKPTRIPARWRRFRFYRDRKWHRDGKWVHAVSGVDVGFRPSAWEPWVETPPAPFEVPEPTLSPEQERRMKAMGRPGR